MPVNLNQYQGTVGKFNNHNYYHKSTLTLGRPCQNTFFLNCAFPFCNISLLFVLLITVFLTLKSNSYRSTKHFYTLSFLATIITIWSPPWLYSLLILLSADVELNPGPKRAFTRNISICHWNLNSISAHNYIKLFLLKAYIAIHKFDIICLSETYLDSSTTSDDDNLAISGYNLIRSDHPSNNKRGGVCIYYKNFLPLRVLGIQYLQECINFELNIGGKICNFISLYRSPSQTQDEFEKIIDNLVSNLESLCQNNPFIIVLTGDLNAKSKNWYSHDKTSHTGNEIKNVTIQFGLQQIIREPTHISNTSSSCIDLIFTSQPNFITDSGVHSSLHSNCHHQIVFAKFNLHIVYPPPYLCEIWHYREANTRIIRRAIKEFN